jgi:uroporphyrinogen decarboxylase
LHEYAGRLYAETDLAIMGRFGVPILETAMFLLGMEQWYVRLATDQDFVRELLDRISRIATAQDLAGIEAAGEYLQIVKVSGEDLGSQNGPLFSRRLFRDILLPPLRYRWDAVRDCLASVNPSARIMLHSCGAIRSYLPELIESGIDIIDPVQPLAVGMEPSGLKADFGERLVFHGGIDIQQLLPHGTPDDVARQTQQCASDFQADRGGYILAPAHNVQADVPPENILAMIEAAKSWQPHAAI